MIGDITILADRSSYVEFTQPYAESGLSMLVPVKSDFKVQKAWMFTKPFTPTLWYATYGTLLYTVFVIYLIERNSDNKKFGDNKKDQFRASLWFTFSSLFFAHSKYCFFLFFKYLKIFPFSKRTLNLFDDCLILIMQRKMSKATLQK